MYLLFTVSSLIAMSVRCLVFVGYMHWWTSLLFYNSGTYFLGDNFFKSVSYTIEAICAAPFIEEKGNLRAVEAEILSKRVELSKFETEYREVCSSKNVMSMPVLNLFSCWYSWECCQVLAQFTEMTSRYAKEMQEVRLTRGNYVSNLHWELNS